MTILQPKTSHQLFEATVNLELDYFITLLEEDMTIDDFGKRVSIKDSCEKGGLAFYFDNYCIFTITPPDPENVDNPIPSVERYYLSQTLSEMDSSMTSTVQ